MYEYLAPKRCIFEYKLSKSDLDNIFNELVHDKRIELRSFGVFSNKKIRPRKYINPKTKDESFIGETMNIHFKSSKSFFNG